MDQKTRSLAGPLWVVGIGLLILGMGIGFMAWVLWNKPTAAQRSDSRPPPTPEELRALARPTTSPPLNSKFMTQPVPTLRFPTNRVLASNEIASNVPPLTPVETQAHATQPVARAADYFGLAGNETLSAGGSTIFGRVTLRGTPPPETLINVTDPNCGKVTASPRSTQFYVVSPDGGLADVFVYILRGLEGRTVPVITNAALIDQRGCQYVPQVLGLQTGQPLFVRNSDATLHNVHFTPTVQGNREVNKAQMSGGADLFFQWEKPELFLRLKCDVHPWMFSYIGVLDHPYFAVTDTNGRFVIFGVPPGRYTVEALHRKTHLTGGKGVKRIIDLKSKTNLLVEFEVTLPR